jgi:hypothetical protein
VTYYLRSGNKFTQSAKAALDLHEQLPPGTYTIKVDPMSGQMYYEIIDNFTVPSKVYGDLKKNCSRIINTFFNREHSTGTLLAGEKGSGKSLLAKYISFELMKEGVPTIVINNALCGESFNQFVQTMDQPALLLFDEFEKVYDESEQEQLLTLLDGVYPSKKLFIITANDKWRIDRHMRNRPGRIFYHLDFDGLSTEFVQEYAEENLADKTKVQSVVNLASLFSKFNFDMLKAIIEEMNRYNETAQDAIRILNTKPESETRQVFNVNVILNGKEINENRYERHWTGNPLAGHIVLWVEPEDAATNDEADSERVSFTNDHLLKVEGTTGTFTFKDGDNVLILVRKKEEVSSYEHLL